MRRVRRQRPMRGHGFMNLLKKGHDFLKKSQIISKTANALHESGIGGKHNALIGKIGSFAGSHGYGRRRVHRRAHGTRRTYKRRGHGAIGNFLRKANDWLKKTGAISKVSGALSGIVPGANVVNKVSSSLGYGRRRRHRRVHHRRVGGAIHRRVHRRRGRGIAQSGVGIGGQTTFSTGRVIF